MTLEIDIDQVRTPPKPKKIRVFGHVMLISTISIVALSFLVGPEILVIAFLTGFLTLLGYFGSSSKNQNLKDVDDYVRGLNGFGPRYYLANNKIPDISQSGD